MCLPTLGRRSSICQKLWRRLAQASPQPHPCGLSGEGGGLVGTHCRARCLGQGSQGTSKTAEYSAIAILSSPMTSVFAPDQKVRASSHCLPSAPRPVWPPPWPELLFPGASSKDTVCVFRGSWELRSYRDCWLTSPYSIGEPLGWEGPPSTQKLLEQMGFPSHL